ncbi:chitin synthase [Chytriomyces confervae]|uniref:chitin synthase n=1 Tax=Chytriomyces confervae TaxID=246404 RepID=A0A507EPN0_9FUNG|nr:chitin synthase [Chytriomyces confervae]
MAEQNHMNRTGAAHANRAHGGTGRYSVMSMRMLGVPTTTGTRRRMVQERAASHSVRHSLKRSDHADAFTMGARRRERPALKGVFNTEPTEDVNAGDTSSSNARGEREESAASGRDNPQPKEDEVVQYDWWVWITKVLTCCCWDAIIIKWYPKHSSGQIQAWREKMASCIIIGVMMTIVAFLTVGLQFAFCPSIASLVSNAVLNQENHRDLAYHSAVFIFGHVYDFNQTAQLLSKSNLVLTSDFMSADLTPLFLATACSSFGGAAQSCSVRARFGGSSLSPAVCLDPAIIDQLTPKGRAYFSWSDVNLNNISPHTLVVFKGAVLNMTSYLTTPQSGQLFGANPVVTQIIGNNVGLDATRALAASYETLSIGNCLAQRYIVGYVDRASVGCSATQFIQGAILVIIVLLLVTRFVMAFIFYWCLAGHIVFDKDNQELHLPYRKRRHRKPKVLASSVANPNVSQTTFEANLNMTLLTSSRRNAPLKSDPFVIILVTCYSETIESIQKTVDSLARTDYPDMRKLLFIVCDGLVTGSDCPQSTPEAVISLISKDTNGEDSGTPSRQSYLAIADGERQHNMATVHHGYYDHSAGGKVPIVAVIKCGSLDEENTNRGRSGNRGKRDSQMILMNFLSSVNFNDGRLTPLDFDLATKIQSINGDVSPSEYSLVLMVDADTAVDELSLYFMVQAMKNDSKIMGLCGETRIENKKDSWVTQIQVFEYYISHHLGKAFESVFGGVTCLPGCFSMYRIKGDKLRTGRDKASPEEAREMVPLLIHPEIMSYYKEFIVDTLHKKNLLLLGEDRYLTTLMLSRCPKRRMIFVPQAQCQTTVPDKFEVLLSQRRRWINSTIHNLLELLMVNNLCGVFCLSMKFVILLELIGTVVLPIAVSLMFVLLVAAFVVGPTLPLYQLLATLFCPAFFILITTYEWEYVGWMFVYLAALPVWNFVLPLYAFWHFDDFSWGATRQVAGEAGGAKDHSNRHGKYETGAVVTHTWDDWRALARGESIGGLNPDVSMTSVAVPSQAVDNVAEVTKMLDREMVSNRASKSALRPSSRKSNIADESSSSTGPFKTARGESSLARSSTSRAGRDSPQKLGHTKQSLRDSEASEIEISSENQLLQSDEYLAYYYGQQSGMRSMAAPFQDAFSQAPTQIYPSYYDGAHTYDALTHQQQYTQQQQAYQQSLYLPSNTNLSIHAPSIINPSHAAPSRSNTAASRVSDEPVSPVVDADPFIMASSHRSMNYSEYPAASAQSNVQKPNDDDITDRTPTRKYPSEATRTTGHQEVAPASQFEKPVASAVHVAVPPPTELDELEDGAVSQSFQNFFGWSPKNESSGKVEHLGMAHLSRRESEGSTPKTWKRPALSKSEMRTSGVGSVAKSGGASTSIQDSSFFASNSAEKNVAYERVEYDEFNILDPERLLNEVSIRMQQKSSNRIVLEKTALTSEPGRRTSQNLFIPSISARQEGSSHHVRSERVSSDAAHETTRIGVAAKASAVKLSDAYQGSSHVGHRSESDVSLGRTLQKAANFFELSQGSFSSFFKNESTSDMKNGLESSAIGSKRRTDLDNGILDEISGIDPVSVDFDTSFLIVQPDEPRRRNWDLEDRSLSQQDVSTPRNNVARPMHKEERRGLVDQSFQGASSQSFQSVEGTSGSGVRKTQEQLPLSVLKENSRARRQQRTLPQVPTSGSAVKHISASAGPILQPARSSHEGRSISNTSQRSLGPRGGANESYFMSMTPVTARLYEEELARVKGETREMQKKGGPRQLPEF